jgi:hypothetical protein
MGMHLIGMHLIGVYIMGGGEITVWKRIEFSCVQYKLCEHLAILSLALFVPKPWRSLLFFSDVAANIATNCPSLFRFGMIPICLGFVMTPTQYPQ